MLGGKVGWGVLRTDNEGQTLAGMGVVAVGGWVFGGNRSRRFNMSREEGGGRVDGERKRGTKTSNKMLRTSKRKKTNNRLMKTLNSWTFGCMHVCVYLCLGISDQLLPKI